MRSGSSKSSTKSVPSSKAKDSASIPDAEERAMASRQAARRSMGDESTSLLAPKKRRTMEAY